MQVFDFTDYKAFVSKLLSQSPKKGRGQYTRLAEVAQTHKATISQIFKGDKHLSLEQAIKVAKHLGLQKHETNYFILLVNYHRAGTEDLRQLYLEQIQKEQALHQELSNRLPRELKLTGEQKAYFYSSWIYSAIRVLSSIPGYQSIALISQRLRLPLDTVARCVEFLIEIGLIVKKNGKLSPGPQSTFLESKSPLISRHHGNWRIKAMERHPTLTTREELAYSAPLSLSSQDVVRVREILARAIEQADKVVLPSPCERFFCLNIDWFEVL